MKKKQSRTVQEIGLSNKVNLCDSCTWKYPECKYDNLIFGDGKGDDNICACSNYAPLMTNQESIAQHVSNPNE